MTYKTLSDAIRSVYPNTSDREIDDFANEYIDNGQIVIKKHNHITTIYSGFGNVYHVNVQLKKTGYKNEKN